jgi:hypothetical protein
MKSYTQHLFQWVWGTKMHENTLFEKEMFKAKIFAFITGMAINFGKVQRCMIKNGSIREVLSGISIFFNNLWHLVDFINPQYYPKILLCKN